MPYFMCLPKVLDLQAPELQSLWFSTVWTLPKWGQGLSMKRVKFFPTQFSWPLHAVLSHATAL